MKEVNSMETEPIKVYRYRWLVLIAFVFVGLMTQVLWITFAPITSAAAVFYGKSDLMIGLLSMVFMIVYILVVLPAAWAIDTWGFKAAVGLGAVLTAVFGLLRGLFASNYTVVLHYPVGIAGRRPPAWARWRFTSALWRPCCSLLIYICTSA
jgi:fucose permease